MLDEGKVMCSVELTLHHIAGHLNSGARSFMLLDDTGWRRGACAVPQNGAAVCGNKARVQQGLEISEANVLANAAALSN